MRVLYFTGAYRPDSMASHTHGDLVAALRQRGATVDILTIGPADQGAAVDELRDRHGTRVFALRPGRSPLDRVLRRWSAYRWGFAPFVRYTRSFRRFFTAERLARYDLIQIGMAYPYATIVRRALHDTPPLPVIVNVTGGDILTDDETGYGYARKPANFRAIRATLQWATHVQTLSPLLADEVVTRYGCSPDRITVQAQQSGLELLPPEQIPAFRAASRTRLAADGFIPNGRLVVGIGRMLGIKGFDDVIRALPGILAMQPDVFALFAGPARDPASRAYVASLLGLARDLGVADHVIVRSQVAHADVAALFAAADIVVIPSLLDGLNMTGVEAGAVGTPCVVSDAAGLATYIRHYDAGMVVPPRAPEKCAQAMTELLGCPDRWQTASAGARTMAGFFGLDRTADAFLAVYDRVTG
ncbi:MAG: glycosyltransferase family 4 protein [Chloroflexota bacterium]|nr:glycosyltransferase family 4 protein [Chloroflexota bacterium]